MSDDFDDIIQRQQAVTLDLRVDILALGAQGKQLDKVGVVQQQAVRIQMISLWAHDLNKVLEWSRVIEEHQNLISHRQQLQKQTSQHLYALTLYTQ